MFSSDLSNDASLQIISDGVFPLADSKGESISRSLSSFEQNWEAYNTCTLHSGTKVFLPWVASTDPSVSSDANFDPTLAYDIKKEDGWVFLFHTLSGSGNITPNKNYMFFYNQRTGCLKVFYYYEGPYLQNNTGFWNLAFMGNQKWLNMQTAISIPINVGQLSQWTTTNAAVDEAFCFHLGWNVFQCQLAYDPDPSSNLLFHIRTYNANVTKVNLLGNFSGYSSGTVVTHAGNELPKNDLSGSVVSMVGVESSRWINDSLLSISPQSRGIIKDVFSKILGKGLNLLFNSITGSSKAPTPTFYDLQFQTQLKGSINGTLSFDSELNIPTVRIEDFNKDKIGCELGAWNLRDIPTVYICPIGTLVPSIYDYSLDEWYYAYEATGRVSYDLVINPELQKHIVHSWVRTDLIRYYPDDTNPKNPIPDSNYDYGTLGRPLADNPIYFREQSNEVPNTSVGTIANLEEADLLFGKFLKRGSIYRDYMRGVTMFRGLSQLVGRRADGGPRKYIDMSRYSEHAAGGPIKYNAKDRLLRVTLFTVTDFEGKRDTTISTKTFMPKIEWDSEIIERYKIYNASELDDYLERKGFIY